LLVQRKVSMKNDYGGVVWTKHALERLQQRDIAQGDAFATFNRPERSRPGGKRGVYVYYKTWESPGRNGGKHYEQIEIVATKDEGKWIILSVWSKPVKRPFTKTNKTLLQKIITLLGL